MKRNSLTNASPVGATSTILRDAGHSTGKDNHSNSGAGLNSPKALAITVPGMLSTLSDTVQKAHEGMSILEDRLGCILRDEPTRDEAGGAGGQAMSPCELGYQTGEITAHVQRLCVRLQILLDRLQLP